MTRTSTSISSFPPMRLTFLTDGPLPVRGCSTLRSLACSSSEHSPISSRNSVPPSASSKSPALSPVDPVNDPATCPNSSDSRRLAGRAAQFTVSKRCAFRTLDLWIASAILVFPVPDSPSNNTGTSRMAMRFARPTTSRIDSLCPTISEKASNSSGFAPRSSSYAESAFPITSRMCRLISKGISVTAQSSLYAW